MSEATSATAGASMRSADPASIEFFAIQLSPDADGLFYVGIEATICECEGELTQMEMGILKYC